MTLMTLRMIRLSSFAAAALALACYLGYGEDEAAAPSPAPPARVRLPVKEHVLSNGLKLLVVERPQAPVVAFNMKFRVGSVNEPAGRSGAAHILEHMLFKGTRVLGTRDWETEAPLLAGIERLALELRDERRRGSEADAQILRRLQEQLDALNAEHRKLVVKEEQWSVLEQNGARDLNAATSRDHTSYHYTLPANRTELWALIESDRLADPVLREYYQERDVVLEERRMRLDQDPDGLLYTELYAHAFVAHPYRIPVIGWPSDIEGLARTEVEEFFRRHYAPNQAVAVAVGDLSYESFVRLAERYFGRVPKQTPPEPVRTVEPPQTGERRALVHYPDPTVQPRCLVGFHRPALGHDDFYALDVLVGLLDGGATARLPRALIDTGLAVQAYAANPDSAYPDLFFFGLTPAPGHSTQELEEVVQRELERLKTEPVPEAEMAKIRHQNEAQFLRQLASLSGLADTLGSYEVLLSWRYIETYPERLAEVSAADIQRVAARYFRPENRTVVTLVPAKPEGQ